MVYKHRRIYNKYIPNNYSRYIIPCLYEFDTIKLYKIRNARNNFAELLIEVYNFTKQAYNR